MRVSDRECDASRVSTHSYHVALCDNLHLVSLQIFKSLGCTMSKHLPFSAQVSYPLFFANRSHCYTPC